MRREVINCLLQPVAVGADDGGNISDEKGHRSTRGDVNAAPGL